MNLEDKVIFEHRPLQLFRDVLDAIYVEHLESTKEFCNHAVDLKI